MQITDALELFGDRILVQEIEMESATSSSLIVIPESVQKQPTQRGNVLAVGPECKFPLKAGDVILYAKYGGTAIELDKETYLILASRDIHARITG